MSRLTTVYVTLLGEPELISKFGALDLAARQVARRITNKYALDCSNLIKENAPVDRGRLRSAVQVKHYIAAGLTEGITSDIIVAVDYAAFMEFGTGPRGRQMNLFGGPLPEGYVHGSGKEFPSKALVDAITAWVKRKGITPRTGSVESLGYAIARKIAREGLSARPFVWPAYMQIKPKWEARMLQFVGEFVAASGQPSKPRRVG